MKCAKRFLAVTAAAVLGVCGASAQELRLGGGLGLETHSDDGTLYSAPLLEADLFVDWEQFGLKVSADLSFDTNKFSSFTGGVVSENDSSTSFREGVAIAPYYVFTKTDGFSIYAGPSLSFDLYQSTIKYDYVGGGDVTDKLSYLDARIGLFFGGRFAVSDKLSVFAELPVSTRFLRATFSYTRDGESLDNYNLFQFGNGGSTSSWVYVTPKVGLLWRL